MAVMSMMSVMPRVEALIVPSVIAPALVVVPVIVVSVMVLIAFVRLIADLSHC